MDLARLFCMPLAEIIHQIERRYPQQLQEIRLRAGRPLMVQVDGKKYFVTMGADLRKEPEGAFGITADILRKSLELMGNYSLFSFENEIRNGYLTVEGGHRIGLVGRVVVEGGKIKSMRHISGLNVRIAHEIQGCADSVLPFLHRDGVFLHTLIVSPPGCGKTTLLRDLIRQISDILHFTVGIADERSEIAGCFQGIPQCDVGRETDVLDGAPKAEGMLMLLRSMNPQIIAVDELGSQKDLEAVEIIMNAGVKLLCTVHSNSLEELWRKPGLDILLGRKSFERIVLLSGKEGPGTIEEIYEIGDEG